MLGRAGAAVLGGTVHLGETTDTDRLSKVDLSSNRSAAHVEPVRILRREFSTTAGLHGVGRAYKS